MNLKLSVEGLENKSIDSAGSTLTTLTSTNLKDENSFKEPKKVMFLSKFLMHNFEPSTFNELMLSSSQIRHDK